MSQTADILAHLKAGHAITPLEALDAYGCFRLAARIAEIRADGHRIVTEDLELPNGKRVARYRMAQA